MRRGFATKLTPDGFHADAPARGKDFCSREQISRPTEKNKIRSFSSGKAASAYPEDNCKARGLAGPIKFMDRCVIVATNDAEIAVILHWGI